MYDIDDHKSQMPWSEVLRAGERIAAKAHEFGIEVHLFRSRGGAGIHAIAIWDQAQDARSVRALMGQVLAAMGLEDSDGGLAAGQVEVFPKQNSVAADRCGSMFILPRSGKSAPIDDLTGEVLGRHAPVEWKLSANVPVLPPEAPRTAAPAGELSASLEELREVIGAHDLSGYKKWLNAGMAIHHETGGSDEGLNLWTELSDPDAYEVCVYKWERSFGNYKGAPITLGSFRKPTAVADPQNFEDLVGDPAAAPTVGTIPKAHSLCTDLANVERIRRQFKSKIMVSAGRFYHFTGTHWAFDEGQAYRYACQLARIVRFEMKEWQAKLDAEFAKLDAGLVQIHLKNPRKSALSMMPEADEFLKLSAIVESLKAWAVRCEMKVVIEAALGALRKLLTIDSDKLDADPWLLNCLNGTIDLRGGDLRKHSPDDYITKCAPVRFEPSAKAPIFQKFVGEIMAEDQTLVSFVQRWYGYCATGSTREQKMLVSTGIGANGKSTLNNAFADVLGEYVGTAAPGLLTGNGSERHPTEIADLFGRRLVTASESDDGAVLREGFVKQATGSDRLKARYMRADFFEFVPTHKLQLLTNHKPQIKGSDVGIWRRVLLLPYRVTFGSPEQIAAGRADQLRDNELPEALRAEREGIFAWIVAGALAWYRDGLNPPDSILLAGAQYQSEQDRVAQFVADELTLEASAWTAFGAVYPTYMEWCRSSGYAYLGKARFIDELARVVPGFARKDRYVGKVGEGRKMVRGFEGAVINGFGL